MVNCWKKNSYPPNFKSRFNQANSVTRLDDQFTQDYEDQDFYDENQMDLANSVDYYNNNNLNNYNNTNHYSEPSMINNNTSTPTVFIPE